MKVFISHSMEDAELAKTVAGALRDAGVDVFDLYAETFPGDDWGAKLSQGLQQSDAMIVLLTPRSVGSPSVKFDLGYALGKAEFRDRVFPVIVAEPGALSTEEIPWILRRFHPLQLGGDTLDAESLQQITDLLAAAA